MKIDKTNETGQVQGLGAAAGYHIDWKRAKCAFRSNRKKVEQVRMFLRDIAEQLCVQVVIHQRRDLKYKSPWWFKLVAKLEFILR